MCCENVDNTQTYVYKLVMIFLGINMEKIFQRDKSNRYRIEFCSFNRFIFTCANRFIISLSFFLAILC